MVVKLLGSFSWLEKIHAFSNFCPIQKTSNYRNLIELKSQDHSKEETDTTSSPQQSTKPSASLPLARSDRQQRLNRNDQIERIQGVWWTSENREQLVEIKSSYAIFDAPQQSYVSTTSTMPPAVAYPLGGTDDIVTLRTFKLVAPTKVISEENATVDAVPEWIPSPTSKVAVQRGGGSAIGTTGQKVSPSSSSAFRWELCTDPEGKWKSDRVVQGFEENLTTLLASEGPHWSASPVDVVRACIEGIRSNNLELVHSLCLFQSEMEETSEICSGKKAKDNEVLEILADHFADAERPLSWSIVKSHYFSPDVCTLSVQIASAGTFDFCISRADKARRGEGQGTCSPSKRRDKLSPSLLFDSITDVELLVNGKTWEIDHIVRSSFTTK
ncbi:unnamed protein product [Pseudo-nitzschia multistriata]|uniref:Uncharacterized protein n=1 Tax=Pseudo-nitzschia multistriata TaxID=183589 RepID=A0A448ZLX6_9STRA|nr:unnamed protein product [Pseudo-nitzschia multistriata]